MLFMVKIMTNEIKLYFSRYEDEVLCRLHLLRDLIFELVPEAEETIRYGIPTFVYKGTLVHYAGYKNHIGFYPTPSGIEAFKNELSRYKQGKGSIQFPLEEGMPVELIRSIVLFRKRENEQAVRRGKR
jgi:uncharacterized protein YdhG (YjbR/CyaY superfamily)